MFDKNSVHSMLSALKWRKDHPSDHHGVIKNICFQILRPVFKSFYQRISVSVVSLAPLWPLHSFTVAPGFHEALLYNNGPLVPWGSVLSDWPPWSHEVPWCHHGLPGSAVSLWTIGSMWPCCVTVSPWFHEAPLYNNGILVP